jgi:hypothetical protein
LAARVRPGTILLVLVNSLVPSSAAWLFATLGTLVPVVHEGGHALAARLVGIHVVWIDLGPIRIRKTSGAWRVGRAPRLKAWGTYLLPESPVGLRRPYAVVLVAGPAAVIGLGSAYAALAAIAPMGLAFRLALWGAALLAAIDGVLNLVPFRRGSSGTDGWKLLQWATNPDDMQMRVASTTLQLHASMGLRPAQWPEAWIVAAGEASPGRDVARYTTARYFAYLAARDQGRLVDAWRYLSGPLDHVDDLSATPGGAILAEAAFHHAWVFRDHQTARGLLDRVPAKPGLTIHRVRAAAAIAVAQCRPRAAIDSCDAVLSASDSVDQPGVSAALKDWVRAIRVVAVTQAISPPETAAHELAAASANPTTTHRPPPATGPRLNR